LGTPYPLLAQGFRAAHTGALIGANATQFATAMLPPAITQLLIALVNLAANCGIHILRRNAASVLRDMLRWLFRACCPVYEPAHHPGRCA
jgi:hypothetical protein